MTYNGWVRAAGSSDTSHVLVDGANIQVTRTLDRVQASTYIVADTCLLDPLCAAMNCNIEASFVYETLTAFTSDKLYGLRSVQLNPNGFFYNCHCNMSVTPGSAYAWTNVPQIVAFEAARHMLSCTAVISSPVQDYAARAIGDMLDCTFSSSADAVYEDDYGDRDVKMSHIVCAAMQNVTMDGNRKGFSVPNNADDVAYMYGCHMDAEGCAVSANA